jgi:hypothetical protein
LRSQTRRSSQRGIDPRIRQQSRFDGPACGGPRGPRTLCHESSPSSVGELGSQVIDRLVVPSRPGTHPGIMARGTNSWCLDTADSFESKSVSGVLLDDGVSWLLGVLIGPARRESGSRGAGREIDATSMSHGNRSRTSGPSSPAGTSLNRPFGTSTVSGVASRRSDERSSPDDETRVSNWESESSKKRS